MNRTHLTGDLPRELAHVLPARDWKRVRPLFGRSSTLTPTECAQAARILREAAHHPLMSEAGAQQVLRTAKSAQYLADNS